jgi:hypothetical protein
MCSAVQILCMDCATHVMQTHPSPFSRGEMFRGLQQFCLAKSRILCVSWFDYGLTMTRISIVQGPSLASRLSRDMPPKGRRCCAWIVQRCADTVQPMCRIVQSCARLCMSKNFVLLKIRCSVSTRIYSFRDKGRLRRWEETKNVDML